MDDRAADINIAATTFVGDVTVVAATNYTHPDLSHHQWSSGHDVDSHVGDFIAIRKDDPLRPQRASAYYLGQRALQGSNR